MARWNSGASGVWCRYSAQPRSLYIGRHDHTHKRVVSVGWRNVGGAEFERCCRTSMGAVC